MVRTQGFHLCNRSSILLRATVLYKFIIIFFISYVFGLENSSANKNIHFSINFRNLTPIEKTDTLKFIKNNNDEIIIHLDQYQFPIDKILSIQKDSLELDLLNDKWWNKRQYISISSSSRTGLHKINPSHNTMLAINDINKIDLIKNTAWYISLLPILITITILKMFGI